MRTARLLRLLPVLLAGCTAKLSSTLPASAPVASYVGAQAGVLTPGPALDAAIDGLRLDLEQTTRAAGAMPAEYLREGDALKLRLPADASFGPDSAQLQAGALEFYAALADVLARRPGTVAHVVVHGEVASSELPTDLTARRAASLEAYLAARGVPQTRLRAEGRGSAQRLTPDAAAANRRIEIVLKPIAAGQEASAWVPPS